MGRIIIILLFLPLFGIAQNGLISQRQIAAQDTTNIVDAEWQAYIGRLNNQNLQSVTDNGNTTTNNINITDTASAYQYAGYTALRLGKHNDTAYTSIWVGVDAGLNNTIGTRNTVSGYQAMLNNTTGFWNTVNGYQGMYSNTTGGNNVSNGHQALYSNISGLRNVANGSFTLYSNTEGDDNIANGYQALYSNTAGTRNIANGSFAMFFNTTGIRNVANGSESLFYNTTGSRNTASGGQALLDNTTGDYNTAIGYSALSDLDSLNSYNVGIGASTGRGIVTGDNNTIIGARVIGLAADLNNNIILATGDGAIRQRFDGTDWTIDGGLILDNSTTATNGNIRYTGTDFEGYTGGAWNSLTDTGTETDPVFSAHTTSNIVDGTGLLQNDGAGNWSYDNSTYLTGNETITLSGDVTGSGATAITTTISNDAVEFNMLNDNVISGQTLSSTLTGTDEILFSDAGLLRRTSISNLTNYFSGNYDNYDYWNLQTKLVSTNIGSADIVKFTGGTNVTISDDAILGGRELTITAAGDGTGTDDQNISGSGLVGSDLTIGIENGTSETISLSSIDYGSWNITGDGSGQNVTSGYTINLSDSDNITINKSTAATSQTMQFDWDADISELNDVVIGQGTTLATGHLLQYDGQDWVNKTVTDVLTAVPVKDIVLVDDNYTGAGTDKNIYDTYITDTREAGVTYEINLTGGWDDDGSSTLELRWYNDDQTGFTELGTYVLTGTSVSDVTFRIKLKVTLRSGTDATGYTTYTYLDMEDQGGNRYLLRRDDTVPSSLSAAGEAIRLRVVMNQSTGDYITVEQGETKLYRE